MSNTEEKACDSLETLVLNAERRAVVATAGGGSGMIGRLLRVPGASQTVLEAVALQAEQSMIDWLGTQPAQYCSEATARSMAATAWRRAHALCGDANAERCIGVGVTAGLATTRPKRGEHRAFVAVHSVEATSALTLRLEKGKRSRDEEETIVERATLATLADHLGVKPMDLQKTPPGIEPSLRRHAAPDAWRELLNGRREAVRVGFDDEAPVRLLFPGSFNPPHEGHFEIARVASELVGADAVYELSVANVDKPSLDYLEIADRLEGLAGQRTLLTSAPTFVEKARLAPGCVFAVGVDTVTRLADPKYCASTAERGAQFDEMKELGCRFLVFGRADNDEFATLDSVELPAGLRELCDAVSEREFRVDISSTELRRDD